MEIESAIKKIKNAEIPIVEKFLCALLLRNGLRIGEICNTEKIQLIDRQENLYVVSFKYNNSNRYYLQ